MHRLMVGSFIFSSAVDGFRPINATRFPLGLRVLLRKYRYLPSLDITAGCVKSSKLATFLRRAQRAQLVLCLADEFLLELPRGTGHRLKALCLASGESHILPRQVFER